MINDRTWMGNGMEWDKEFGFLVQLNIFFKS